MNEFESETTNALRNNFHVGGEDATGVDPRVAFYRMGYAAGRAELGRNEPSGRRGDTTVRSVAFRLAVAGWIAAVILGGLGFAIGRAGRDSNLASIAGPAVDAADAKEGSGNRRDSIAGNVARNERGGDFQKVDGTSGGTQDGLLFDRPSHQVLWQLTGGIATSDRRRWSVGGYRPPPSRSAGAGVDSRSVEPSSSRWTARRHGEFDPDAIF